MGDVARPMLAEVLAALTDTTADAWTFDRRSVVNLTATGATWTPPGAGWYSDECPWTITDPAEAQECLVSSGLLPDGWCDPDCADRWLCGRCEGTGGSLRFPCGPCEGTGVCDVPAGGIPDLVAVSSLGWPAIQRAEELACAACAALREYGCPQPERVVWRVGVRSLGYLIVPGRGSMHSLHHRAHESDAGPFALWLSGLALDAITADAVRIVVPPVGGVR